MRVVAGTMILFFRDNRGIRHQAGPAPRFVVDGLMLMRVAMRQCRQRHCEPAREGGEESKRARDR